MRHDGIINKQQCRLAASGSTATAGDCRQPVTIMPASAVAAAAAAEGARLICGLGNGFVGRGSRHGLGLLLVEELATLHGAAWVFYPRLAAYVAELPPVTAAAAASEGESRLARPQQIFLLWPLLPYNVIGWSVAAAAQRFGIPSPPPSPSEPAADSVAGHAITLVHDDLDRAPGKVSFRVGGSAGGNNGIRSCISSLGTEYFRRCRVGIGRPQSRDSSTVVGYVLGAMPESELAAAKEAWMKAEVQERLLST